MHDLFLRACPLLTTGHCAEEDQVLGVPGDHREGEQGGGRSLLGTQLLVFDFKIILVWFLFFMAKNLASFLKRKIKILFWLYFSSIHVD